ncbi:MAG: hypothetical protein R3F49_04990 [Planctomycetota bacterium]
MAPLSLLIPVLALTAVTPVAYPQDGDTDLAAEIAALRTSIERLTARLAASGAVAPSGVADPAARLEAFERHQALVASSPFADLRWQFLGPTNISGRVVDVAAVTPRGESYTMYAATASGGLWRSKNEGTTWEPITERLPTASMGDLALDPSDQSTLWLGTGEANIFRSSMAGLGVYRSVDGGETWEHRGLGGTHTIARIVVHPHDSNVVYVAASGAEWGADAERGVYRTQDAGETWEKVLFVGDDAGAIDLVMDPTKPEILYASTWQRQRKLWNDPRAEDWHTRSSIWRTSDGGEAWEEIAEGLPAPQHRGRIGIDVARSNPSVLYAFVDNYEPVEPGEDAGSDSYGRRRKEGIRGATLFRSDDRGAHWRQVSESSSYMERLSATYGWVFGQVRVDPTDEDTVYIMGLALNVSNDGGVTFRRLSGMHGDHHALWIDPSNPRYMINGNDGGLNVTYDGGERWRNFTDELPAVQFYNVGFDMDEPFHVYGSIQDHGSRRRAIDLSRGRDRIRATDWEDAPGGEASHQYPDPTDPNTLYAQGFYGSIFRADLASGARANVAPTAGEGQDALRGQWLAPFVISPHNPRILYHGMNHLYRSLDRGERFQQISPDLSYNDPDKKGDIPYQTIFSISESPSVFGRIYAGTDDGRLHRTDDSGATWHEVTAGLAADRWIARVIASAFDEDTVYVAQNGKRNDDFAPYLWRSRDRGRHWQEIGGGIPCGPINVVREDPHDPDLLYVGTDVGVYVTLDGAATWHALSSGLPTTYVHDLIVHPREDLIVIATHGRGMYALDARPIQRFGAPQDDVVADESAPELEAPEQQEGDEDEEEDGGK